MHLASVESRPENDLLEKTVQEFGNLNNLDDNHIQTQMMNDICEWQMDRVFENLVVKIQVTTLKLPRSF